MNKFGGKALLILLPFLMSNANAVSNLIINYNQLVIAVESGDNVKAIIHLDKCQITDPAIQNKIAQNIDGASTRMNFNKYLHIKIRINGELTDTVSTSTNSRMEHSEGVYWNVYARLNVFDDNTAMFHVDLFNKPVHKPELVVDWKCTISNGRDENGLYLINSGFDG